MPKLLHVLALALPAAALAACGNGPGADAIATETITTTTTVTTPADGEALAKAPALPAHVELPEGARVLQTTRTTADQVVTGSVSAEVPLAPAAAADFYRRSMEQHGFAADPVDRMSGATLLTGRTGERTLDVVVAPAGPGESSIVTLTWMEPRA